MCVSRQFGTFHLPSAVDMSAHVYRDTMGNPVLVIHAELSPKRLAKALPLSDTTHKRHFVAHFLNGFGYLAAWDDAEWAQSMTDVDMVPIDDARASTIVTDAERLCRWKAFAAEQLAHGRIDAPDPRSTRSYRWWMAVKRFFH